jgi:hypothetical protein
MTIHMERGFPSIAVVDGLDLFEPERKRLPRQGEPDADENVIVAMAKSAGARDRQQKKD